ncbi:TetR/AcrR family transcriptional regulator [Nocardiaceae bacterium NPDC056970]
MSVRRNRILDAAVRVIARTGVRGLRIETLAAEAGVSPALIYYHFQDRAGVLRCALEHVDLGAERYTEEAFDADDPRTQLEQMLLLEIRDTPPVRENSVAWNELRASAVFDDDLRPSLQEATGRWSGELAELVTRAQDAGVANPRTDPVAAAERLTALVEGLSSRWLSGSITLDRARELLAGAIAVELGPAAAT